MKAKLIETIKDYDEDKNYIVGWGAGRLWGAEEEIPKGTIMEIIGHTMLFVPKDQFHPEHYEPVVIVAYNNPSWWKKGDEFRCISYLPAGILKVLNEEEL